MAAPRTEVVKDADEIVATREAIKTELARVAAGGEAREAEGAGQQGEVTHGVGHAAKLTWSARVLVCGGVGPAGA